MKMALPYHTKLAILRIFQKIAESEYAIEIISNSFLLKYCPASNVFNSIDFEGKGYLTEENLLEFLRDYCCRVEAREALSLLTEVDTNEDGKISFNEFCDFLKCTNNCASCSHCRCKVHSICEARDHVARLLLKKIQLLQEIDRTRVAVLKDPDFSLIDGFQFLDHFEEGSITKRGLLHVVSKLRIGMLSSDIETAFNRLDKDGDGCLSLLDFIDAVFPSFSRGCVCERCDQPYNVETSCSTADTATPLKNSINNCSGSHSHKRGYACPCCQELVNNTKAICTTSPLFYCHRQEKPTIGYKSINTIPNLCNCCHSDVENIMDKTNESYALYKSTPNDLNSGNGTGSSFCSNAMMCMLKQQILLLQEIKQYQCALALRPDFNLILLWRLFDPHVRGYATLTTFSQGLKCLGFNPTAKDIKLYFNKFSRAQDGRCRYADLCDAFVPADPTHAERMINRVPKLEAILYRIRNSKEQRELQSMFRMADIRQDGCVSVPDFRQVLSKCDIAASWEDTLSLLSRLSTRCTPLAVPSA
ncbi:EF hand domain-containing protein [Cardiosporidium cionae]|uniref:EF hand domain-containing protein n=1 Tax=Cardiosporidium cionae TaxID=476202 RepID=A0ABQ7JDL5_9APIC|nr:EF hand domain-containing protein [Cardiosporidium cionae]|eukprot:KAF8822000.1 EF hand domain-containing protein [Cardiosporidium cionae]